MNYQMKNFSTEQTELLRSFLFTAPHSNVSLIYPQQLVAGEELAPLISAYSRSNQPLQERVLEFVDKQKNTEAKALLPHLPELMKTFRNEDGSLKISKKTRNFSKKWVLAHGHSSIKEMNSIFGCVEGISDICGKLITGHPLAHPQVKSSRYISFEDTLDMALVDPDIQNLSCSNEIIEHLKELNTEYLNATKYLANAVFKSEETDQIREFLTRDSVLDMHGEKLFNRAKKKDPELVKTDTLIEELKSQAYENINSDEYVMGQLEKFVLDRSRVYLPGSTRTSLGFMIDGRTCEEIITTLLTSPLIEAQSFGNQIWTETKKISPVLLGDQSHIKKDEWKYELDTDFRKELATRLDYIVMHSEQKFGRVYSPSFVHSRGEDTRSAVMAAYKYSDFSFDDLIEQLKEKDVKWILDRTHEHRNKFDQLHESGGHGGMLTEMTMPYHGYRDMFRHRKGARSNQLYTTVHGFENVEIFNHFDINSRYELLMNKNNELFRKAAKENPHAAQKVVAFGQLCRAAHSWSLEQIGYIARIRANIETGNISYVKTVHQIVDGVKRLSPQLASKINYNQEMFPEHIWKEGYDLFRSKK
ncbi:hypothetical protein HOK68_05080 [Candidatus Woesearchaeota archaeon]|jgi:thymidylate synthase ThyX|nr:hypothetical protein [Candidatus Woesearchaeota archaeon]MBT4387064.1 hypothetical protein [Candidatus Woesearchaeota archaeon]MBT4596179.1 hypothetical protein [Candidatus Woesearchaeota archaeon]MBT5741598.1 hypothetical protein [Candidatus Woesearchaeota archaeon]MBT6506122.1 hypothetical protein [Candidatus Woesearchaeota archaeon]